MAQFGHKLTVIVTFRLHVVGKGASTHIFFQIYVFIHPGLEAGLCVFHKSVVASIVVMCQHSFVVLLLLSR